jgi:type IV fimbrial biogenesis protein FimT
MAHPLLKGGPNMKTRNSQSGYSLAEMLTVVAIIGIMSLIIVPNFVQYYRSIRLKTAMRRLANDLRGARQRAVARNSMVMVSYKPSTAPASYTIFESLDTGTTWSKFGNTVTLDKPISLVDAANAANQLTDAYQGDGLTDAVFKSDGTALLPVNVTTGQIIVKTSDKVNISSYTVSISSTGKIAAQ